MGWKVAQRIKPSLEWTPQQSRTNSEKWTNQSSNQWTHPTSRCEWRASDPWEEERREKEQTTQVAFWSEWQSEHLPNHHSQGYQPAWPNWRKNEQSFVQVPGKISYSCHKTSQQHSKELSWYSGSLQRENPCHQCFERTCQGYPCWCCSKILGELHHRSNDHLNQLCCRSSTQIWTIQ